jgi:hypothetical protein
MCLTRSPGCYFAGAPRVTATGSPRTTALGFLLCDAKSTSPLTCTFVAIYLAVYAHPGLEAVGDGRHRRRSCRVTVPPCHARAGRDDPSPDAACGASIEPPTRRR